MAMNTIYTRRRRHRLPRQMLMMRWLPALHDLVHWCFLQKCSARGVHQRTHRLADERRVSRHKSHYRMHTSTQSTATLAVPGAQLGERIDLGRHVSRPIHPIHTGLYLQTEICLRLPTTDSAVGVCIHNVRRTNPLASRDCATRVHGIIVFVCGRVCVAVSGQAEFDTSACRSVATQSTSVVCHVSQVERFWPRF